MQMTTFAFFKTIFNLWLLGLNKYIGSTSEAWIGALTTGAAAAAGAAWTTAGAA